MKINLKSPYFVTVDDAGLTSCTLELFAYSGIKNTSRPAAIYTLESEAENGKVIFEIASLAVEYIDYVFDLNYDSQTIWVDYRLTKSINGTPQTPDEYVNLEGFYGYGYFEDGVNPQTSIDLLQDNTKMLVLADTDYYIPVKTENLTQIDYYFVNGTTSTEFYNIDQNNSANLIKYITVGGSEQILYDFQDQDDYLFQDGNEYAFKKGQAIQSSGLKKLELYYTHGNRILTLENINECKYFPYEVIFVNKYGALQNIWFFKNSKKTINLTQDDFDKNILVDGSYSINEASRQILSKQGREGIKLNSGYYPEQYNEVFQQLLLSDYVWLKNNGDILPLDVDTSSFSYQNRLYEKLINYEIDFKFSFDKINKIR